MKHFIVLLLKSFFSKDHTLILFQNNNEIRATGGFITSVVDISKFKIKFLNVFKDLSKHPPVKGPAPLMEMLNPNHLKSWSLRDANYYPEFATSANKVIEFYKLVFPKNNVNGVIAINFSFIELVLKKLGAIKIKNKTINSENLFYFLSAKVSDIDRHSIESLNGRKKILRQLAKKLIKKILINPQKWHSILAVISKSIQTKDIQVHNSNFPNKIFNDGKNQDFFSIIESNFLGLKSNRYIKKTIFHDTFINSEGSYKNDIRIIWEHMGHDSFPLSGTYNAYVRIYVNKGFKLLSSDILPHSYKIEETTESNLKVIGTKLAINPGEKLVWNLVFDSKKLSPNHSFKFKYFKQSGSMREHFHKTVIFQEGSILSSNSSGIKITENVATYDVSNLEADIKFKIALSNKKRLPRIISHSITSQNQIDVTFSRAIKSPIKKTQAIITPKGESKQIKVKKLSLINHNRTLRITLVNLSTKPEAFYTVNLTHIPISDTETIYQNGRTITVVYRPQYFYEK